MTNYYNFIVRGYLFDRGCGTKSTFLGKKQAISLNLNSIESGILKLSVRSGKNELWILVNAGCFEEKLFYAAGPYRKHNALPAQVVLVVLF